MKAPKEREAAFRRDLAELLAKHDAELVITDDHKPWGLHSAMAIVSMPTERDADDNITADYTEFTL